MSRISRAVRRLGPALFIAISTDNAAAEPVLDVEAYVQTVLRAHPAAQQLVGLEAAARGESKAGRALPDPVLQYSRSRARPSDPRELRGTERGYSVSQTLPWPGTLSANVRAGDRAAAALRASGEALGWELAADARGAFARLVGARQLADIARAQEQDARSLRDLVTTRADLGESRESERLKAEVEWRRQQQDLVAAEREAEAAEAALRALAVEALPEPLVLAPLPDRSLAALESFALIERLDAANPRLRAARSAADRERALLSVARRGRIPDLDLTYFHQEELDKRASGFSLGIKLPLWNATRAAIARGEASAAFAAAEAARTRLDLAVDLGARIKDLQIAAARHASLETEILPAASRSVELARFSYQEGETSLLDLLDSQRTHREAQREAVQARLGLEIAAGDLQRLLGPAFHPWR